MYIETLHQSIRLPTPEEIADERAYIESKIIELGADRLEAAIREAVEVREYAYPPYSGYKVGATIITKSGATYSSCNAEAVSFSGTDHAEKSAITRAIASGEIEKNGAEFIEAVIVSHPGASGPCGECRQRIAEHCRNALIIDVDENGSVQAVTSLKTLFFYAFTPTHLDHSVTPE